MKELLSQFEESIHKKDAVVKRLTDALTDAVSVPSPPTPPRLIPHQRNTVRLERQACTNRIAASNTQREAFCSHVASAHHTSRLLVRVFRGWRGCVKQRWRHRLELACQKRAQAVCETLQEAHEKAAADVCGVGGGGGVLLNILGWGVDDCTVAVGRAGDPAAKQRTSDV